MKIEVYEFEPNRWSYSVDGTPSGETFPSRQSALIASSLVGDKDDRIAGDKTDETKATDPQI